MPFWSHTATINAITSINNGRVTFAGSVIGNPGTSHIVVDMILDRINPNGTRTQMTRINNIRQEGNVWAMERHHNVARGHYYQHTMVVRVTRNGSTETIVFPGPIRFAH